MKIQSIINHIPSINWPNILPIQTKLEEKEIVCSAVWYHGEWDGKTRDLYDVICGYGYVTLIEGKYHIKQASTKYFPSANYYLTYDSFWCDEPDLNEQLQNMIDDNEYISLGLSPIPTQTIKSIRYEN